MLVLQSHPMYSKLTESITLVPQGDPVFGELTENITLVVRYFNHQVEKARGYGGWDWSVEKVLDVIKGALTASLPSVTPLQALRGAPCGG